MSNMDPTTGIRYGIISANSLDPEIVQRIQSEGVDIHYEAAKTDLRQGIKSACEDYMSKASWEELVDQAVEMVDFQDDEPVHEFDIEGVRGQTTWLGGALLVWIFHSPYSQNCNLCSPCVPNAGDLNNPNPEGYETYMPPTDWYDQSQL